MQDFKSEEYGGNTKRAHHLQKMFYKFFETPIKLLTLKWINSHPRREKTNSNHITSAYYAQEYLQFPFKVCLQKQFEYYS